MFLSRGECRGHAGCARDVEFAAIPHIIAKSAKYPPVMGTATGCNHFQKKYYWIVSQRGGIAKQNRTSLIKLSYFYFYNVLKIYKKDAIPGILG
jgi:hypothetical protein